MDGWPSEVEVARLAEEVAVCVDADCLYSPSTDTVRHMSGEPFRPPFPATNVVSYECSRDVIWNWKAVVAKGVVMQCRSGGGGAPLLRTECFGGSVLERGGPARKRLHQNT